MFLLRFLFDAASPSQSVHTPLMKREEYLKDPSMIASQDPFLSCEDYEEILEYFGVDVPFDLLTYNSLLRFEVSGDETGALPPPSLGLSVQIMRGGETSVFSLTGRHTEFHCVIKQSPVDGHYQLDHIHIRNYDSVHEIACGLVNGDVDSVEKFVGLFKENACYLQQEPALIVEDPELRLAKALRPVLQDLNAYNHRAEPVVIKTEISPATP